MGLVGNVSTVAEAALGLDVDGVVGAGWVALVEADLVEVVAPAAAMAVVGRAEDQDGGREAALIKWVVLLTLRDATGLSVRADDFRFRLRVRAGATGRRVNSVELGGAGAAGSGNTDIFVTNGAGGGGETSQESNGEENSETHVE